MGLSLLEKINQTLNSSKLYKRQIQRAYSLGLLKLSLKEMKYEVPCTFAVVLISGKSFSNTELSWLPVYFW